MAELFTMYYISIIKYLATLYQVWCLYHSYVGKAMKVKILWHHSEPFGSSLSHFSYFFQGTRPSISGPTCYPYLLKILGFDHFCTSISFLAKWSPYFSSCDGTCKNRYLSFPCCTMGYSCNVTWCRPMTHLAFQEPNVAILSSNVIFFDGPTTQAKFYFISTKCSFECCANTFPLLCKSYSKGLVINLS
jgi:hypothetical protein